MGYIRHHAIAVTTWSEEMIKPAHEQAKEIFGSLVSDVVKSSTNGYVSFFIAPDGSKEGWAQSELGDRNREKFIEWVHAHKYEDDSNPLSYCEFYYGDDNCFANVIRNN